MTTTTDTPDLAALQADFKGRILVPDDADYEDARTIHNSMIEKRPAVIAQCAERSDVATAIGFARENGLEIAIRGGGHSVAGASLSEGGIVIDLRNLNRVEVDPEAQTATAETGALWHDFDAACQPHGLIVPGGRVSTTGVSGLTLGGGSAWFERKFGLACDSLVSVELVTAAGETIRASADEHADLFWALHGGGGNFGVATELVFGLHELEAATLCLLMFSAERGPEVVRAYRDMFENGAPEELGGGALFLTGPPEPFVPEDLQGKLVLGIAAFYAGTEAEAREAIAPILALGPAGEMIAELPYVDAQCALDDPPGFRNYWSAEHLHSLPDEAIDLFCERAAEMVVPSLSQHILIPWGGQVGRGVGDYPQPYRDAAWVMHPFGVWEDPADDEKGIAWARGACADMKPFATGAVYLNFIGDEGADRVAAGYGEDNYRRLQTVKGTYDPDNVFQLNQNIVPNGN